jgi:hypothetical protein
MVVGLFVAPLAMVGAIGVTAAAIGAALGAAPILRWMKLAFSSAEAT